MDSIGTWSISIVPPLGIQAAVFAFIELREGISQENEAIIPLSDLMRDGNRLTWKQPMTETRLNLTFDVSIEGHTLSGTSKAEMLPPSKVTGTRIHSYEKELFFGTDSSQC